MRKNSSIKKPSKLPPHHSAPDGGWGWAVVVGSHMCIFFGVGWLQTISIYLVPLQEEFGSSSAVLGWVVSSGLATTFLTGPLGSLGAKKLGCRKACFLGGIILGCGFIASFFAQSPLQLFFTVGIITGTGCSFVHLSAHIATSQYFTKRHGLANGLSWLGSSIGQFISAPFLQLLIDYYGWRGAMLIEGGLVFNTLVAAMFFRPIHHIYKRKKSVAYLQVKDRKESCVTSRTPNQTDETKTLDSTSNNETGANLPPVEETNNKAHANCSVPLTNLPSEEGQSSPNHIAHVKTNGALSLKLQEINEEIQEGEAPRPCCRRSTFFLDSPAVLVVCVVNFLMAYAIQGYYAHVVAKAIGQDISQDKAAFILSTYAIGSLLARLTHGFFIDHKLITPLAMYALALSTGCVGAFSAVFATTYAGFLASGCVLGMSSGVFYPIIPVVMRSLVGLKRMGHAYGIAMVFDGTGVVTGGLMAGLIKDITGDYNISFIQAGATFAIASACILAVIIAQKCSRQDIGSSRHQTLESPSSPI